MSIGSSRMDQTGDDDELGHGGRTYAFRSADSSGSDFGRDDDDFGSEDDVVSRGTTGNSHDELDGEDAAGRPVVHGSVVHDGEFEGERDGERDAFAADERQPSFTPADDAPTGSPTDPAEPTLTEQDDVPVVPAGPEQATGLSDAPGTVPDAANGYLDSSGPLLGDPVGLRASWQAAQAGFVDDPRAAVAEAADLVEHTAQTLIGSLQQRQRALRTQWDNNGSDGGTATATGDTEQLRHLMKDYRNLFNQLCQQ